MKRQTKIPKKIGLLTATFIFFLMAVGCGQGSGGSSIPESEWEVG
ncbi:hypothetical protein J2S74_000827 [Evansella vedderi]|uniref:Uncharacterized protein n=1 Tax=Evansella vedderi TaxID=38282 RepID=A0ABT9ZQE2_9BACI|nr:hypothetical protein [Evansella vedderi]MDQ0253455.1 hypothetical protein [Evansella vedderi]